MRLLVLMSLVLLFVQGCEQRSARKVTKELKLPDQSDPRFVALATKVPRQVITGELLSELVARVELAKLLRSPVILRGGLDEKKINLRFDGGTLKDFLEGICAEGHVIISFEKFCVSIQPE
jgi:hypothetical protein